MSVAHSDRRSCLALASRRAPGWPLRQDLERSGPDAPWSLVGFLGSRRPRCSLAWVTLETEGRPGSVQRPLQSRAAALVLPIALLPWQLFFSGDSFPSVSCHRGNAAGACGASCPMKASESPRVEAEETLPSCHRAPSRPQTAPRCSMVARCTGHAAWAHGMPDPWHLPPFPAVLPNPANLGARPDRPLGDRPGIDLAPNPPPPRSTHDG